MKIRFTMVLNKPSCFEVWQEIKGSARYLGSVWALRKHWVNNHELKSYRTRKEAAQGLLSSK